MNRSDDTLLLLFNAHHEIVPVTLPQHDPTESWAVVFDTHRPTLADGEEIRQSNEPLRMEGRSLLLLRLMR